MLTSVLFADSSTSSGCCVYCACVLVVLVVLFLHPAELLHTRIMRGKRNVVVAARFLLLLLTVRFGTPQRNHTPVTRYHCACPATNTASTSTLQLHRHPRSRGLPQCSRRCTSSSHQQQRSVQTNGKSSMQHCLAGTRSASCQQAVASRSASWFLRWLAKG